MKRCSIHQK